MMVTRIMMTKSMIMAQSTMIWTIVMKMTVKIVMTNQDMILVTIHSEKAAVIKLLTVRILWSFIPSRFIESSNSHLLIYCLLPSWLGILDDVLFWREVNSVDVVPWIRSVLEYKDWTLEPRAIDHFDGFVHDSIVGKKGEWILVPSELIASSIKRVMLHLCVALGCEHRSKVTFWWWLSMMSLKRYIIQYAYALQLRHLKRTICLTLYFPTVYHMYCNYL